MAASSSQMSTFRPTRRATLSEVASQSSIQSSIQPSIQSSILPLDKKNFKSDRELVDTLFQNIRSKRIGFPYHSTYGLPVKKLWKNLLEVIAGNSQYAAIISDAKYILESYHPQHRYYLPPLCSGNYLSIATAPNSYRNVDILSDYFVENIRLRGKRINQKLSPAESWNDDRELRKILTEAVKSSKNDVINAQVIRETLSTVVSETTSFNLTWSVALIQTVMGKKVRGKKWLDISAGWGDRLAVAIAMGMKYQSYDPNVDLKSGHDKIISTFAPPRNRDDYQIFYEPFENAVLTNNDYDLILSSPPFFNLEIYAQDQKGQSIVEYRTLNTWLVQFLFVSLVKAWAALKDEGFLMLYLGDTKSDTKSIQICESTNLFIENYLRDHGGSPNASWVGIIGLIGHGGKARPVWVWQKVKSGNKVVRWNPDVPRSLGRMYPVLANMYLETMFSHTVYNERVEVLYRMISAVADKPITSVRNILPNKIMMESLSVDVDAAVKWGAATVLSADTYDAIDLSDPRYSDTYKNNAKNIRDAAGDTSNMLSDQLIGAVMFQLDNDQSFKWAAVVVKKVGKRYIDNLRSISENRQKVANAAGVTLDEVQRVYPDDILFLDNLGPLIAELQVF